MKSTNSTCMSIIKGLIRLPEFKPMDYVEVICAEIFLTSNFYKQS